MLLIAQPGSKEAMTISLSLDFSHGQQKKKVVCFRAGKLSEKLESSAADNL